ncbi:MAG: hypothetical protein WBW33_26970 [Bryobacteraceae bacterium]
MQPDAIERALMSPDFGDDLAAMLPSGKRKQDGTSVGTASTSEISISETMQWPAPIDEAAYYGLAGDIVRTIAPQTEADPVALLVHILVGTGSLFGRGPHARVGGESHHTNENAICVGKTSSARKGTAKSDTFKLLSSIDPAWTENRVMSGLSSGEGLIWAVRDQIEKLEPLRGKGRKIVDYQNVIVDKGVTDKRLLVIEPEFASVLRAAGRDGNTLSTVYRQAWESGKLRVLNKNSPVQATGAHISIIGHITRDELLMELSNNDKVNGFGNRNLWLCVQRSKFLPDGGDWNHLDLDPLISRLKSAVEFARLEGQMRRDADARAMWHAVYPKLSGERQACLAHSHRGPSLMCFVCPASMHCSTSQPRSRDAISRQRWLCGSTARTRLRLSLATPWATRWQTGSWMRSEKHRRV